MDNHPKVKVRVCKVWWCNHALYAGGYCEAHYRANKRFGTPYGIKDQKFILIDELVGIARTLAKDVLNTEGLLNEECAFCHELNGQHKEECAVAHARMIQELTRKVGEG